jgi:hypothetical protein
MIIALLPLAALTGRFGPSTETATGRAGSVEVSVRYPTRLRYEMSDRIEVTLRNRGSHPLNGITLSLDPEYAHAFSGLEFSPEIQKPYVVEISELQPGDERLVAIELHADRYGSHSGELLLSAGKDSVSLQLNSLIFP